MKITIIRPAHGHRAYAIAAGEFASLAEKTAGAECKIITDLELLPEDGSPLVVIGTDAVNHYAADRYLAGEIGDFSVRMGTDDYQIRTERLSDREVLIYISYNANTPREFSQFHPV